MIGQERKYLFGPMENSTFLTRFHYSPYSLPILAEFGGESGQVVPHTQGTVLRLKDNLSPYLSHGCTVRCVLLGVLAGFRARLLCYLYSGYSILLIDTRHEDMTS
jgi:hypothetical protein